MSANGKAVAILQDNELEIKSSRDNYSLPIGKTLITKDLHPQWRKLEWSPDGTFLAVAHTNGSVDVYNLFASHLFVISVKSTFNFVPENGIAGLAFIDSRTKTAHWSYELLCLDYYGVLRSFYVSPIRGFLESHVLSFTSSLSYGITSFYADQSRNLLVVGTPSTVGSKFGLSLWKLDDEHPYYTRISQNESDLSSRRWFQSFQRKDYGNTVVKLSPSADGCSLAAIHLSGAVSVWTLPALECQHFWPIDRQPGYDELNPF